MYGLFASILALMDVLMFMERRFIAKVHADFAEKRDAGELVTEQKHKKRLAAGAEALLVECPEWAALPVWLVAGAGFEPAAFRL